MDRLSTHRGNNFAVALVDIMGVPIIDTQTANTSLLKPLAPFACWERKWC